MTKQPTNLPATFSTLPADWTFGAPERLVSGSIETIEVDSLEITIAREWDHARLGLLAIVGGRHLFIPVTYAGCNQRVLEQLAAIDMSGVRRKTATGASFLVQDPVHGDTTVELEIRGEVVHVEWTAMAHGHAQEDVIAETVFYSFDVAGCPLARDVAERAIKELRAA